MATLKLNNTTVFTETNGIASIPTGVTIGNGVKFPAGHILQVLANQSNNFIVNPADTTTAWTDGSTTLSITLNCISTNPKFLVIQTAGHSYNHSQTLYGNSYFTMKCNRGVTIYRSALSADTWTAKQAFNLTNNNSTTFYLNYPSYQGSNHNDSGQKPTTVEYFFSTSNIVKNTSFTFTPGSKGNNYHGIYFPSIIVMEIKS